MELQERENASEFWKENKVNESFTADFVKTQNLTLGLHAAKCQWRRLFKYNVYCILYIFEKLGEQPKQLVYNAVFLDRIWKKLNHSYI